MPQQANTEYFFRLIYDLSHGGSGPIDYSAFTSWAAHLWLIFVYVGYAVSAIGLFLIVYTMVRLFELREREEHYFGTLLLAPDSQTHENLRWAHIQELLSGGTASEWREAIIEADIMLHDVLTDRGYQGDGVAEKLRTVDQADIGKLQDAWEAHKVRNQIAHEGSAFQLSQSLAQRTIQRYEAIFREFGAI